jgi:hypothetical protein
MNALPAAVFAALLLAAPFDVISSPAAAAAPGQAPVDFSGTWSMDPARSESTRQGEPIKPVTITIAQSAAEVRIDTTRGEQKESIVYPLGRTAHAAATGANATLQPEAYWDGDRLVTQTQRQVQGYAVTVKEVRSLAAGGQEMIMETTVIVQHGYTMPGVKNYGTARDVFTKTP